MKPLRVIDRGFSATVYDTSDGYVLRVAHNEEARHRHLREAALLEVMDDSLTGYELPFPTEVLPPSVQCRTVPSEVRCWLGNILTPLSRQPPFPIS